MVVRHALSDAAIDRVFHALADATRRDIVARVLAGEVLEGAALVTKQTQGRERIVRGNPERIARARDLLARLEGLWRARFSQLDSVFTNPSPEE